MRLVDAGRVELDAPVTRYLPAFRTATTDPTPITVRQLLDQTSGLPGSATGLVHRSRPRRPDRLARDGRAGWRARCPVTRTPMRTTSSSAASSKRPPARPYRGRDAVARLRAARDDPHDGRSRPPPPALGLGDSHRIWFGIPTVHAPLLRPDLVPAGFIVSTAADVARPIEMLLAGGRIGDQAFLSRAGGRRSDNGRPSRPVSAMRAMAWAGSSAATTGTRPSATMGARPTWRPSRSSIRGPATAIVVLANAQAIPYEVLGKIDMIGFGALDLMLGREPNGTLEKFYAVRRHRPDRRCWW